MRWATLLLVATVGQAFAADVKPSAEAVFATKVLPALKAKSFAGQGDEPKKLKGGIDLTTREKVLAGGESGKPGVAKTAADSPLYRSVARTDADFKPMPPKENDKLTDAEVAAFKTWIDGGAPWPSGGTLAEETRPSRKKRPARV